jgi:hypothetical protein
LLERNRRRADPRLVRMADDDEEGKWHKPTIPSSGRGDHDLLHGRCRGRQKPGVVMLG